MHSGAGAPLLRCFILSIISLLWGERLFSKKGDVLYKRPIFLLKKEVDDAGLRAAYVLHDYYYGYQSSYIAQSDGRLLSSSPQGTQNLKRERHYYSKSVLSWALAPDFFVALFSFSPTSFTH